MTPPDEARGSDSQRSLLGKQGVCPGPHLVHHGGYGRLTSDARGESHLLAEMEQKARFRKDPSLLHVTCKNALVY